MFLSVANKSRGEIKEGERKKEKVTENQTRRCLDTYVASLWRQYRDESNAVVEGGIWSLDTLAHVKNIFYVCGCLPFSACHSSIYKKK